MRHLSAVSKYQIRAPTQKVFNPILCAAIQTITFLCKIFAQVTHQSKAAEAAQQRPRAAPADSTAQPQSPATAAAQQRPRAAPADDPAFLADSQTKQSSEGGPRKRPRSHRSPGFPADITPKCDRNRLTRDGIGILKQFKDEIESKRSTCSKRERAGNRGRD